MPSAGETAFVAPYVARHSRLTTFFRAILAIPHYVVLFFYGIAAWIAVVVSWFAIVITGRYPRGLYDFNAGYLRYATRVNGYVLLLSDVYPPFGGGDQGSYPVEVLVGPPKESYGRLSAFFRFLPLIVVWAILYVLSIVQFLAVVVAWFVILVLGRLPEGLHNLIAFVASYQSRSSVYAFLLTESFPSFDGAPAEPVAPTPVA